MSSSLEGTLFSRVSKVSLPSAPSPSCRGFSRRRMRKKERQGGKEKELLVPLSLFFSLFSSHNCEEVHMPMPQSWQQLLFTLTLNVGALPQSKLLGPDMPLKPTIGDSKVGNKTERGECQSPQIFLESNPLLLGISNSSIDRPPILKANAKNLWER